MSLDKRRRGSALGVAAPSALLLLLVAVVAALLLLLAPRAVELGPAAGVAAPSPPTSAAEESALQLARAAPDAAADAPRNRDAEPTAGPTTTNTTLEQPNARPVPSMGPNPEPAVAIIPPTTCLIMQCSEDGMGHQVDARVSLMALAEMYPSQLTYVHHPFGSFQHTSMPGATADAFFGFDRVGSPLIGDARLARGSRPVVDRSVYRSGAFLQDVLQGKFACRPTSLYCVDNAFEVTHGGDAAVARSFVAVVANSTLFRRLRRVYWHESAAKPAPRDFSLSRLNVVVHVRRGDAGYRMLEARYFLAAMRLVERLAREAELPAPLFHVHSDSPDWPGIAALRSAFPQGDVHVPRLEGDLAVLAVFHALASANVSVLSDSSLGFGSLAFRDPRPAAPGLPLAVVELNERRAAFKSGSPFLWAVTREEEEAA